MGSGRPAGDPTPPNGCDQLPPGLPRPDFRVLMGDTAIGTGGFGKFTALRIRNCDAVSMERTPNGISFDAQLIDSDDNKVVQISHNEIKALNGETYIARQSRDRATIMIATKGGTVLFYARFINKTTVRIRGLFGCGTGKTVLVKDDGRFPGVHMSNSCFETAGRVGIQIN